MPADGQLTADPLSVQPVPAFTPLRESVTCSVEADGLVTARPAPTPLGDETDRVVPPESETIVRFVISAKLRVVHCGLPELPLSWFEPHTRSWLDMSGEAPA